jgi:hypothetical protein
MKTTNLEYIGRDSKHSGLTLESLTVDETDRALS